MKWKELKPFNKGMTSTAKVGIGQEAIETVREARNVRLANGNVVTRPGWEVYCNFQYAPGIAGETIQSLGEYKRESYDSTTKVSTIWKVVVFSIGDALYYVKPEDSTIVGVLIDSSTFTDWTFRYINLYDNMWFLNAVDPIYTWDGYDMIKAGIPAPETTAPTATVNVAGSYSIKYLYTYYRDGDPHDKESAPSEIVTVTNMGGTPPPYNVDISLDLNLAVGEVIDPQVTHIRIYRTEWWDPTTDEEPEVFYRVDSGWTIAAAAAASYVYEDDVDTVSSELPAYDTTERFVPPLAKYALWHDSRLFLAGDPENPSVIYYSEPGKPWYFPTLNYDEVNRDDGSIITGIGAIGATRYIFKENVIYEWTGNPETATPIRQVERPDSTMNMNRVAVGCYYPDTLVGWNNSLLFRSQDGDVYMLTQDRLTNLSRYYQGTRNLGISCFSFIKEDYLYVGDGDETYVCYLPTGSWESIDSYGLSDVLVRDNYDVLEPEGDTILRLLSGTTDNGSVITKTVQTRYTKIVTNDNDIGIIRGVLVEASAQVAFTVTVYNEKGESVTGTLLAVDRVFQVPYATPLRGKFASAKISWTGDTEIYSISIGYMTRRDHTKA